MAVDIQELNEDNFEEFIRQGTVLVDFWATWCGPCRSQGAILDKLSKEEDFNTPIGKLNVDDARDLTVNFEVMSIPTLIIFKDGNEVQRMVGVQQPAVLKDALK